MKNDKKVDDKVFDWPRRYASFIGSAFRHGELNEKLEWMLQSGSEPDP